MKKVLGALLAAQLTAIGISWADSSSSESGLVEAVNWLSVHASGFLTQRWDEAQDLEQNPSLNEKMKLFLKLFGHPQGRPSQGSFGYFQNRRGYGNVDSSEPGITRYSATPVYLGSQSLWYSLPRPLTSNGVFLYQTDPARSFQRTPTVDRLILPLRVERDLVVFGISHGPLARSFTDLGWTGGITLAVALRLKEYERPSSLERSEVIDLIRAWGSESTERLNSELSMQMERYPQLREMGERLHQGNSKLDLNRLYLNLVFRDLKGEFETLVHTTAALHGPSWIEQAIESGGIGFFETPTQEQYLIQTVYFDSALEQDKKFIVQLATSELPHQVIMRQVADKQSVRRATQKMIADKLKRYGKSASCASAFSPR